MLPICVGIAEVQFSSHLEPFPQAYGYPQRIRPAVEKSHRCLPTQSENIHSALYDFVNVSWFGTIAYWFY